ncbi:HEAT repeat-containing protein 4 [Callorhinchus milii]|uniref:HEAT repeat-containing protein 4 n=1 Tax=Callorhinchus milii TaxID=7868 RepID=UPI001C3F7A41|nr:HEAT repeat-containing protein 4 [Callorhinchus milii]
MVKKWLKAEGGERPRAEQRPSDPGADQAPDPALGSFKQRLREAYVKTASLALSFSEDVVEARGPDALPSRPWDPSRVFDPGDVVPRAGLARSRRPRARTRRVGFPSVADAGQGQARGSRPASGTEQPAGAEPECQVLEAGEEEYSLTAMLSEPGDQDQLRGRSEKWDEYLVKRLSKNTAQWLVSHRVPPGPARTRLSALLMQRYGSASTVGLVTNERMSQSDFVLYQQRPAAVSEEALSVQPPLPEMGLPTYYRVPGFEQTQSADEEPGGVNQTAAGLMVKHFDPSTPKKRDTSPRRHDYNFISDNQFQQELYSGKVKMVHRGHRYRNRILMDNYSEYKKNLQVMFPQSPANWRPQQPGHEGLLSTGPQRVERGAQRWKALPTLANYTSESGLRPPEPQVGLKHLKVIREPYQTWEELHTLAHTLEEWRRAWKINSRWQDVTVESLKRDLESLYYHIQVIALATCANAAVNRPKIINVTGYVRMQAKVEPVPVELWPLIAEALNSCNTHVQMAAALCHAVVGDINPQTEAILQEALHRGNEADRWAAAQCLALKGDSSYLVVSCLVKRLFDSPWPGTVEQCCVILGELSKHTTLVHTLLADELNSSNWRSKVLTFSVLSRLNGHINQDLTNKMVYLMWNDWNSHVRQAAASSLGALGLGKVVHDQLRQRLENGSNRVRVEALAHLGQLGMLSGKLLGPFLRCFSDDFNGVRREACLTATALRVKDQRVLFQLKRLIQSDPVWTVKAYAIKGPDILPKVWCPKIGHVTPAEA